MTAKETKIKRGRISPCIQYQETQCHELGIIQFRDLIDAELRINLTCNLHRSHGDPAHCSDDEEEETRPAPTNATTQAQHTQ